MATKGDLVTFNHALGNVRSGFSPDFVFGAAGAAYQYEGAAQEGGRGPSIWDTFTDRYPGKIKDGSNGFLAVDSYHRYKEDVQIIKKIGLKAYRFSIAWSRVLPSGKLSAGVNREGIEYYNNLINELLANGIEPYVTLFHFDVPQALESEYGGFLSHQIVHDFRDYVEVCFWEFGDRVKHWITLNEPWTFSHGGYVTGGHAPGRGSSSQEHIKKTYGRHRSNVWHGQTNAEGDPGTEPYIVTHHQLLAHSAAVELYRQKFQTSQGGQIGITLVSEWMEPLDENNPSDQAAAGRALDFMFGWFMEPLTTGDYPQSLRKLVGFRLPHFSPEQAEKLKKSYNFLGLNYYTGKYATTAAPQPVNEHLSYDTDQQVTFTHERDGKPIGHESALSWLHNYPDGFYKLLLYVKNKYNVPLIYVTENGWVDANKIDTTLAESCHDHLRINYYKDHLSSLLKAIDDGVNVKGYFAWSLLDNYEWGEGYTVRFGLVNVDYKNGLSRFPKDSAIWLMNFLKERDLKLPAKRQLTKTEEDEPTKRARK